MSVRQSLLAILDQGPCYGYQLRTEFDRRTGSVWPLNVGQIYNTLERLERDGLVARGEPDDQGHVYWRITDTGTAAVSAWLVQPVVRNQAPRDELAIKISLAATLPGADASAVIMTQRAASARRLRELEAARAASDETEGAEDLTGALVLDSLIVAADAELRWLDLAEERLTAHAGAGLTLGLETQRPKRGRPAVRVEPRIVA
ncbi:MAG: PadR family transcriptional regulator [Actinomycetota bacterium]